MNINWNDSLEIRKIIEQYCLRLLSISSVNSDSTGIQNVFNELEKICKELDFCYDKQADGLVMRISNNTLNFQRSCKLALVCHIDTVNYDKSKWMYNPLGEISNGRIYGRGIIDDKGALVLALVAAKVYEKNFNQPWIIIVGSSEEGIWIDMEKYHQENHPIPDYATTIDGDGVQFGSRGYADIKFIFKSETLSKISIKSIDIPGGATNIVPGFATATLSNGKVINKTGKACHSSIPHNGKNALILLTQELSENFRNQFPTFLELVNDIKDCTLPDFKLIDTMNSINEITVLPTSVCPTACKIEDGLLTVNLNFRISIGVKKSDFLSLISNLKSRYNASIQIVKLTMPNFINPDSPMIKSQLKAYEEIIGKKSQATIAPGIGYNAAFKAKYGCNIFGPRFAVCDDEEDLCHSDDENRSIDDLLKFYQMLCIFMKDFLS